MEHCNRCIIEAVMVVSGYNEVTHPHDFPSVAMHLAYVCDRMIEPFNKCGQMGSQNHLHMGLHFAKKLWWKLDPRKYVEWWSG